MRLITLLSLFFIFLPFHNTDAHTAVYVGRKSTVNGTTVIAGSSNERVGLTMPYLKIYDATSDENGNAYRYLAMPLPPCLESGACERFSINEQGVAFTVAVTADICSEAAMADSLVKDGIALDCMASVAGTSAVSARQGIELIAGMIDKNGNLESGSIMIADSKETWYMEIYTGHQYCAIRMPNDMAAVFGSEFMLDTVDSDSDGVICSKELFSIPSENGFAVMDSTGRMNLRHTYQGEGRECPPMFFKPDKKLTAATVKDMFREQNDGIQEEVHVIEVYSTLPKPLACVAWLCLSEAAHAPFVPVTVNITELNSFYAYMAPQISYDANSAYQLFKRIDALCAGNIPVYSEGVRKYWSMVEQSISDDFYKTLINAVMMHFNSPSMAASMLTTFENNAQHECIDDARRLFDELNWHSMQPSDSDSISPFIARFEIAKTGLKKGWDINQDYSTATILLQRKGKILKFTAQGNTINQPGSMTAINPDGTKTTECAEVTMTDGKLYLPMSMVSLLE